MEMTSKSSRDSVHPFLPFKSERVEDAEKCDDEKEIDRNIPGDHKEKKAAQRQTQRRIPSYCELFQKVFSAEFLRVRDGDEDDARSSFISVNQNLALVNALLFTCFVPLYYTEPARLFSEDDGLTVGIMTGLLASETSYSINIDIIHDFFDASLFVAVCGTFFGTLVSVYYSLAAIEAGNDDKVLVLKKQLGFLVNYPYFSFGVGSAAWGFAILCNCVLVPRSTAGWIIKVLGFCAIAGVFVFQALPGMARGIYAGLVEEETNPPVVRSKEEIALRLKSKYTVYTKCMNLSVYMSDGCIYLCRTSPYEYCVHVSLVIYLQ
jgi:hypothetical protein